MASCYVLVCYPENCDQTLIMGVYASCEEAKKELEELDRLNEGRAEFAVKCDIPFFGGVK